MCTARTTAAGQRSMGTGARSGTSTHDRGACLLPVGLVTTQSTWRLHEIDDQPDWKRDAYALMGLRGEAVGQRSLSHLF